MPIFRACKNAKFSLQHPIIFWCFGLTLNYPKDWKKKKLRFHGKWKVSLDTLIHSIWSWRTVLPTWCLCASGKCSSVPGERPDVVWSVPVVRVHCGCPGLTLKPFVPHSKEVVKNLRVSARKASAKQITGQMMRWRWDESKRKKNYRTDDEMKMRWFAELRIVFLWNLFTYSLDQ